MHEDVQLPRVNGEEKLRKVWRQMKSRCDKPTDGSYYKYGGRGIRVCDAWYDYFAFRSWSIENGYEDGLTIDRIDNEGNYEPSNCRWTDLKTQSRNTRTNRLITAFGETKTMMDWSEDPRCVVSYAALSLRIGRRGWDDERALITPIIHNNEKATHCPQGHEYTPDNIYWDGPNKTWRKCATCCRIRSREGYRWREAIRANGE